MTLLSDFRLGTAVALQLLKSLTAKAVRVITAERVPPSILLAAAVSLALPLFAYGLFETFRFGQRVAAAGMELIAAYFGASFFGLLCICVALVQVSLFSNQLGGLRRDFRLLPLSSRQARLTIVLLVGAPTIFVAVIGLCFVVVFFSGAGALPTGTVAAFTSGAASSLIIWVAVMACAVVAARLAPSSWDILGPFGILGVFLSLAVFWYPFVQLFADAPSWLFIELPELYPSKFWLNQTEEISALSAIMAAGVSALLLLGGGALGARAVKSLRENAPPRRSRHRSWPPGSFPARRGVGGRPSWQLARLGASRLPWLAEALLFALFAGAGIFISHRIADFGDQGAAANAALVAGLFCTVPAAKAPGSIFPQVELQKLGIGPGVRLGALLWLLLIRTLIPLGFVAGCILTLGHYWMIVPVAAGFGVGMGASIGVGRLMSPVAMSVLGQVAINGVMSIVALLIIVVGSLAVPVWPFVVLAIGLAGFAIIRKDERGHVAH